ncbi:hypothetical protein PGB90_009092 [Kerria lacca]
MEKFKYNKMIKLILFTVLVIVKCSCRIPRTDTKGNCSPGQLVWVDCNLCLCNREGQPNKICALMWCPPPPTRQPKHILNENYLNTLL